MRPQEGLDEPEGSALNRVLRWSLVLLAFAGFLISSYLTASHWRESVPPCYVTSGCESVVTSRYSTVAGLPLSLFGSLYFGAMFYLGVGLLTSDRPWVARLHESAAGGGVLVALGLFLLQAAVLRAYCSYCLATEIIALLMWIGILAVDSSGSREQTPSAPLGRAPRRRA
jgi:uncharacterized membrane protein